MNSSVSETILRYRRIMRHHPTGAEKKLWSHLRNRQVMGAKFRRQHAVGHFIIDFYCHETRLAIEVDGENHAQEYQAEYDNIRTMELESCGVRVLRFWNSEVLNNIGGVLDTILAALTPTLSQRERERT